MEAGGETTEVMVGRQPIYDHRMNVRAYELLFREAGASQANVVDGNHATSQVLYNTFIEIGLDSIVGRHKAFVNLTPAFLMGEYPLPKSSGNLVLEILEDIEPTPELVESIRKLREQGYTIALDDFVYSPHLQPLVDLANIIKIDITQMDEAGLAEHVQRLRRDDQLLLAEKVETYGEFEYCQHLGFDLYQGYFFCRPNIIKGKHLPTNRLALMQLLSELQREEADIGKLEQLISQDVTLSYRLIRLINSAAFALSTRVESISRALMLLGLDAVRNWASLLALSNIDDKPMELVRNSAVRARMAELVGGVVDSGVDPGTYFTAGLFSNLDALVDKSMDAILDELPLSEQVCEALLTGQGSVGVVLQVVLAYEQAEWEDLERLNTGIPLSTLRQHYLEAIGWADSLVSEVVEGKAA
ncbi:MAG: EAL and HDOD domain-containing protein [Pseudomonadota bacterium]